MTGVSKRRSRKLADEVSSLITTLHRCGQRLEELTAGEVDAVLVENGETLLLPRAQKEMLRGELARQAAILNALPANVALLDADGRIISVNQAWRAFADGNGLRSPQHAVNLNYLDICRGARGTDAGGAVEVAEGLRAVLAGERGTFSIEYPCDSPTEPRWFLMTAESLDDKLAGGAVVMHVNVTARKLAEREVQESRRRLDGILASARDAILTVDDQNRIVMANPAAERMFGYPFAELDGQPLARLIPERFRSAYSDSLLSLTADDAARREIGVLQSLSGLRKNGEEFLIEASISNGASAGQGAFTAILRDVTERSRLDQQIRRLNRVFAMMSGINMLIVRAQDRDELFRGACRIAIEAGGFLMALVGLIDQDQARINPVASAGKDEALLAAVKRLTSSRELTSTTMVARAIRDRKAVIANDSRHDPQVLLGNEYAAAGVRSIAVLPLVVSGEALGAVALYAGEKNFFHDEEIKLLSELADDIAFAIDRIDKRDRLNYLAYYDELTGLANRSLFLERLAQFKRSALSGGRRLAVYLLDVERFAIVNDTLGRLAGDLLLKLVGQWLIENAGDAGLVARIGANQFAAVIPDVNREEDVARFIEMTLKTFADHPFRLNGSIFRIAAKAGIALFPDDGDKAEMLLRNAELALEKAKASGDRLLFYTPKLTEAMAGRLDLETRLSQALVNQEFALYYQPKVNLRSGKVIGAEAVLRWNDPITGLVLPGVFIGLLEESGLIHEVGGWALRRAVEDGLRWRSLGLPTIRVAVNVSPLQLRRPDFVDEIREVVGVNPRAAEGLELEITESVVMDDVQQNIDRLHAIRKLGVTLAIDDFGTGYSSLSYLSRLPLDTLKIDRSFIIDLSDAPESQALVATIITLAHALKLKVVAEGVETEAQSRILRLLSCDETQGFLLSKAVSCEEFETRFLGRAAD